MSACNYFSFLKLVLCFLCLVASGMVWGAQKVYIAQYAYEHPLGYAYEYSEKSKDFERKILVLKAINPGEKEREIYMPEFGQVFFEYVKTLQTSKKNSAEIIDNLLKRNYLKDENWDDPLPLWAGGAPEREKFTSDFYITSKDVGETKDLPALIVIPVPGWYQYIPTVQWVVFAAEDIKKGQRIIKSSNPRCDSFTANTTVDNDGYFVAIKNIPAFSQIYVKTGIIGQGAYAGDFNAYLFHRIKNSNDYRKPKKFGMGSFYYEYMFNLKQNAIKKSLEVLGFVEPCLGVKSNKEKRLYDISIECEK